jgi:hypothetical protein
MIFLLDSNAKSRIFFRLLLTNQLPSTIYQVVHDCRWGT